MKTYKHEIKRNTNIFRMDCKGGINAGLWLGFLAYINSDMSANFEKQVEFHLTPEQAKHLHTLLGEYLDELEPQDVPTLKLFSD